MDRASLIAALRLRYDAHSAATIFTLALGRAGLADQPTYSAARSGDAWFATIPIAPDAGIAFKFLRSRSDGTVIWEGGANRTLATASIETTWQADEPPL